MRNEPVDEWTNFRTKAKREKQLWLYFLSWTHWAFQYDSYKFELLTILFAAVPNFNFDPYKWLKALRLSVIWHLMRILLNSNVECNDHF